MTKKPYTLPDGKTVHIPSDKKTYPLDVVQKQSREWQRKYYNYLAGDKDGWFWFGLDDLNPQNDINYTSKEQQEKIKTGNTDQSYSGGELQELVVTPNGVREPNTPTNIAVETDWTPEDHESVKGTTIHYNPRQASYLDYVWKNGGYYNGKYIHPSHYANLDKEVALVIGAPIAALNPVTGMLAGAAWDGAAAVGETAKWGLTTPAGQALTKKFIGDALLGTAGYMGFDALSTAVTGKTFGQNVADMTGNVPVLKEIPYNWREFAGSLVQPGGYMAIGKGQVAANLLNRAERTAGKVARTSKDYVASNYNYLKNTKFKGVPEGGNMEAYVPKTVKQNVETGVKGTIQQLENLGVTDLPQITTTYENMPLTGSYMGHTGDLHVGFDAKTLHNPFKYWKVYNEKPGLGINYSFMAGHEPAHLVHPSRAHYMKASGEPMLYEGDPVVKGFGTVRGQFDISQQKYYLDPKTNTFYPEPGTYYTAPDELLEVGLFKDINKPRQNIMKELPNTPQSQAHLRAPQEMDADLYALYNMGHIKNGQISDEGIQFLMQRHNLSKEGVLNTIDDLQVIGYGNALSGEPVNANWVPGNQSQASKIPSATIDWRSVKDGIIPELIWKKQGGTLNYLNYFN